MRNLSVTEDAVGRLIEVSSVTYRADRFVFTMTSVVGTARSNGAEASAR